MKNQLCPICYEILEVKDVTQCYVCGGWPGAVENFNSNSSFKEYYLDSGQKIVLCHSCWLDEILSLQGDLADDLKLPISGKTAGGIHFSRDIFSLHPENFTAFDVLIIAGKPFLSLCTKELISDVP